MEFHGTVLQSGKTATGIQVPAEIVEGLGSGKRPPVRVTINAYTYRTTVAPMGGAFMIPVSAEVRERAGVAGDDDVEVGVELDSAPREVTVPPEFASALDADIAARQFFDGLSYSKKRWHVLSIEGVKTEETRQRRIVKSIAMLREGKG